MAATLVGALPFEGIKFGANEFFRRPLPLSSATVSGAMVS